MPRKNYVIQVNVGFCSWHQDLAELFALQNKTVPEKVLKTEKRRCSVNFCNIEAATDVSIDLYPKAHFLRAK